MPETEQFSGYLRRNGSGDRNRVVIFSIVNFCSFRRALRWVDRRTEVRPEVWGMTCWKCLNICRRPRWAWPPSTVHRWPSCRPAGRSVGWPVRPSVLPSFHRYLGYCGFSTPFLRAKNRTPSEFIAGCISPVAYGSTGGFSIPTCVFNRTESLRNSIKLRFTDIGK